MCFLSDSFVNSQKDNIIQDIGNRCNVSSEHGKFDDIIFCSCVTEALYSNLYLENSRTGILRYLAHYITTCYFVFVFLLPRESTSQQVQKKYSRKRSSIMDTLFQKSNK